jgi:hypothetical protein
MSRRGCGGALGASSEGRALARSTRRRCWRLLLVQLVLRRGERDAGRLRARSDAAPSVLLHGRRRCESVHEHATARALTLRLLALHLLPLPRPDLLLGPQPLERALHRAPPLLFALDRGCLLPHGALGSVRLLRTGEVVCVGGG